MDDSLLKEHLKFKKRATQSLEAAASLNNSQQKRFKQNSNRLEEIEGGATESQTIETGTKFSASGSRFGLLASVIQFLKTQYQKGNLSPLSLKEITDQLSLNVNFEDYKWLATQALLSNPKVIVYGEGASFCYRPKYSFKTPHELLLTLKALHTQNGGGITMEEIVESLPNAETALQSIQPKIHIMTKNRGKNKIIFYKDMEFEPIVDEEFVKRWREIAVDSLDSHQLEKQLSSRGHKAIRDISNDSSKGGANSKANQRRFKINKLQNDHLQDILKDFNEQ